jgi:8-oxo-dGTP pyrophosphatase MutT (NUDIX family)
MWQTLPGAGVLAVRNGCVLMVLHYRGGKYRWELPSGYVNKGESMEQCAIREVMEETSVSVAIGSLLCTVVMDVPNDNFRGINAYFCASSVGDEEPFNDGRDGEPILRAAFVDLAQVKFRDIHPVDRKILKHWMKYPYKRPFYFRMVF